MEIKTGLEMDDGYTTVWIYFVPLERTRKNGSNGRCWKMEKKKKDAV